MAVTVPSSDTQHYNLQSTITSLTSQITNAGNNGPLVAKLTQDKRNVQFQLVSSLLGSGYLSASSILANETYSKTPTGDGQ